MSDNEELTVEEAQRIMDAQNRLKIDEAEKVLTREKKRKEARESIGGFIGLVVLIFVLSKIDWSVFS